MNKKVLKDQTVIFSFSLRAPQCANFTTENEKEWCESDQHFDIDGLIDQMVETLRVGS